MAIQRKGILGPPKGKIANIHFYDRLGKSIVQSVGKSKDKFATSWPLVSYRLTLLLSELWEVSPSATATYYNSNAPSGMSGKEFFINSGLDISRQLRLETIGGLDFRNMAFEDHGLLIPQGNWNTRYLSLRFPPSSEFITNPTTSHYRVIAYKQSGVSQDGSDTLFTPSVVGSLLQIPSFVDDTFSYLSLFLRTHNKSKNFRVFYANCYNPEYYSPSPIY